MNFSFLFRSVLFSLLLLLLIWMPNDSPALAKWFIVAVISSCFVGWEFIKPRLGVFAALLFGYCAINGAWFWIWEGNRYLPVQAYDQLAIRYFAADGIAKLLLVIFPLLYATKNREKFLKYGGIASALFCLINVGLVYYALFFEPNWCRLVNSCGGALSNPSINSCLIVVTLPFLIARTERISRIILVWLAVVAVFISKGSIGIGLLAAMACLYSAKYWKALALAPVGLLAGYKVLGVTFLNSGDRFEVWRFMMERWARNSVNYPFGTGYGTFGVFSANLQISEDFHRSAWWIWMHNDWLEILFTLGIVGLILSVLTYANSLLRLYFQREYTETISLILLGLTMTMNYPLHHPISCMFAGWLIVAGLLKPDIETRNSVVFLRQNC